METQSIEIVETMPSAATASPSPLSLPTPKVSHYEFLDGMRGIGALIIVLGHSVSLQRYKLSQHDLRLLIPLEVIGHLALTAFFLLSGWCLMIPVAISADLELRGGFRGYIARRAQRILPSYYAAILTAYLLPAFTSFLLKGVWPKQWFVSWGGLVSKEDLLTHIVLIHNFWRAYVISISAPFWSVAMEWQIYFLFALVLLPVLRRFGMIACLLISLAMSVISISFSYAGWVMIISFTLGMLGAVFAYSPREHRQKRTASFTISKVVPLLCLTLVNYNLFSMTVCSLIGVGVIYIVSRQEADSQFWSLRRVLESRVAVSLGKFSYSIYLMHYILLTGLGIFASKYHLSPRHMVLLNIVIGIPLALIGSYIFYLCFEKPFLHKPKHLRNLSLQTEDKR